MREEKKYKNKNELITYGWHECSECKAHYQEYHNCNVINMENELTNDIGTLIELCLPDLREIVFHSDGRVIAKTGGRAKFPKKLYGAKPKGIHDKSALVVDVLQKLYTENILPNPK